MNLQEKLLQNGWFLTSQSPLIITTKEGDTATGRAAQFILDALDSQQKDFQTILNQIIHINDKIALYVSNVTNDDDSRWEVVYDMTFNNDVSKQVYRLFEELHVSFDYYDPDTSYQEDVMAFHNALTEKIQELQSLHPQ